MIECIYRLTGYTYVGAEGRSRTDTVLLPPDFESGASTNFATPAYIKVQFYTITTQFGSKNIQKFEYYYLFLNKSLF